MLSWLMSAFCASLSFASGCHRLSFSRSLILCIFNMYIMTLIFQKTISFAFAYMMHISNFTDKSELHINPFFIYLSPGSISAKIKKKKYNLRILIEEIDLYQLETNTREQRDHHSCQSSTKSAIMDPS